MEACRRTPGSSSAIPTPPNRRGVASEQSSSPICKRVGAETLQASEVTICRLSGGNVVNRGQMQSPIPDLSYSDREKLPNWNCLRSSRKRRKRRTTCGVSLLCIQGPVPILASPLPKPMSSCLSDLEIVVGKLFAAEERGLDIVERHRWAMGDLIDNRNRWIFAEWLRWTGTRAYFGVGPGQPITKGSRVAPVSSIQTVLVWRKPSRASRPLSRP